MECLDTQALSDSIINHFVVLVCDKESRHSKVDCCNEFYGIVFYSFSLKSMSMVWTVMCVCVFSTLVCSSKVCWAIYAAPHPSH